jgi:hypothetical protein
VRHAKDNQIGAPGRDPTRRVHGPIEIKHESLEKVKEAFARIVSGKAQFLVVLTMQLK